MLFTVMTYIPLCLTDSDQLAVRRAHKLVVNNHTAHIAWPQRPPHRVRQSCVRPQLDDIIIF